MNPDIERIAKVCHEANRAYCAALGDFTHLPWANAPSWQRSSAANGVRFHLGNPDAGPDHSHVEWMKEKVSLGWTWGPEKNEVTKQHPCMVPFNELPALQQVKDFIFRAVVHAMA